MYQQHHRQHNRRSLLKEQQLQSQQLQAATQQSQPHIRAQTRSSQSQQQLQLQHPAKEGPIQLTCGPLDSQQQHPQDPLQQRQHHPLQHHHHHHHHQQQKSQQPPPEAPPPSEQQQQQQQPATTIAQPDAGQQLLSSFESRIQPSMAYQHKHALHRLRRLKKRAPHRDLVISFVPRLRTSIINRLDFFNRYSKQEQEVLSCFDFLDELVLNYCDGGLESPRYSQKLYQSMIYEFIDNNNPRKLT